LTAEYDDLWDLERAFWRADAEFYDRHLSSEARMLFPEPVGLIDRAAIIESVAKSTRWQVLETTLCYLLQIHPSIVLLSYHAVARRKDDERDYRTHATSIYRRDAGTWKLAFHQQTPDSS
jgi:hypothetical protein